MQKDFDVYRKVIMQLNPRITAEEWGYFQSGFTFYSLGPKEYFIEAGKRNHQLGFVTSGLIRSFYTDQFGDEITTSFITERQWATDYPSLLMNRPSRYNFQCLEATTVITVPYAHLRKGYDQFVGFRKERSSDRRRSAQVAAKADRKLPV